VGSELRRDSDTDSERLAASGRPWSSSSDMLVHGAVSGRVMHLPL
jgi:hypothetical protein